MQTWLKKMPGRGAGGGWLAVCWRLMAAGMQEAGVCLAKEGVSLGV